MEQRVNDVVSRLTLEEKVAQMLNATPAIPRLGIPAYDWWNEVLHGVARTPFQVTYIRRQLPWLQHGIPIHYKQWPIILHWKEELFITKQLNWEEQVKDIWD